MFDLRRYLLALVSAVVAMTCSPALGFAATLAGWDVHSLPGGSNNFGPSPMAATVSDPGVSVGGFTRGSGVSTTGSGAARAWGGTTWYTNSSDTETSNIAANRYATFTVTPNAGNQVSFTTISQFNYRRSGTGPASGAVQYQIGTGSFTDITTVSYTSTASTGASLSPIDLSGIAALQNVPPGTTVTFRIVNWGATSTAGTWYIFDVANTTANDFEIQGTVSLAGPVATQVRVETAADGSGLVVPAQNLSIGSSVSAYAISRDASNNFIANVAASWSLTSITGGIVAGDLVAAGDNKSAVFTPHAGGTAIIHVTSGSLTSVDSGLITVPSPPTNPMATGLANPSSLAENRPVLLTVTVVPGANPTSTGLTVTGDLTQLGGAPATVFHDDGTNGDVTAGDNIFSFTVTIPFTVPGGFTGGTKSVPISVVDAQARSAVTTISATVLGSFTIFHTNDTHSRITPHQWIIPSSSWAGSSFETVGGAAYLAAAVNQYTTAQPNSLFIDGGDVSEGNPIGDMNGNLAMIQFYTLLSNELKAQRGRGIDAVVVGNHDVRDVSYITNLGTLAAAGVPVISVNVRDKNTHAIWFAPYTIVTVNGTKIGILGYTTQASEVGASLSDTLEVADCDWNSTDSTKIHLSTYVNELRNNQGCNVVILAAHVGHSAIATDTTQDGEVAPALLSDDGSAKLPEIAITGHWHTWASTVWEPESLNYKTIFAESSSFMKYLGELQVTGEGRYVSSAQHVLRNADYEPDLLVENLVVSLTAQYDQAHSDMPVETVLGYTADDLMLDHRMKWWSADDYPWDGNNTAGQWICDAMQWKATALFGQCDLSVETGGGVRSDIPAGPVTFLQAYETFPWSDDTFYRVNMTGQDLYNFFKVTGCDAGFSSALHVTAHDGIPTAITFNGQPVDLAHTYTVAINSYMYQHPPTGWTWTDSNPLTSPILCRDGIVQFMQQFPQSSPYHVGGPRYNLDTEFSGGYRAVITMMNDNDTKPVYDDAFIRLISATPDTLIRLGSAQVPTSLVQTDGTVNPNNRLSEIELYRSYLGFKTGALKPGDIIETWGKGSYYRGDPEFVDQEGIYSDGIEFNIVGHDDSLAKPAYVRSASSLYDDNYKNHYVKFLAKRTGTSTAVDQNGQSVTIWDATAYTAKTGIPGNVGDLLFLTGVPTMENYGIRFRCATAELASAYGITDFPASSDVTSTVASVPALTTNTQVTLTANASAVTPTSILMPVADAQVESGVATGNYGTSTNLYVQSSSTSSYGDERAWLKFDLSSLPSNAVITKATLSLYNWKAAGAALPTELRSGVTDDWTETGITWNTQPALGDVLATQTLAAGTYNVWYSWDVTSFVQSKWTANKLASFVLKAQTEDSTDTTAPSYGFDSKEYGSNSPTLQITTAPTGASVASVDYYYRYSSDGRNWGSWTAVDAATNSPYAEPFNLANGYGYYEFYSTATDSQGASESAPPIAEASTHYVQQAPYNTVAIVQLGNVSQTYNGASLPVTVTTTPPSLAATVTYNGAADVPVHPGNYTVVASVTQPGFTGSATGTLVIARAPQSIQWSALTPVKLGAAPFSLAAASNSGLPITYTSSNPSVASVSGATVTVVGIGTTSITATQSGSDDYLAAPAVSMDLVVSGAITAAPAMPLWALAALVGSILMLAIRMNDRAAASRARK